MLHVDCIDQDISTAVRQEMSMGASFSAGASKMLESLP